MRHRHCRVRHPQSPRTDRGIQARSGEHRKHPAPDPRNGKDRTWRDGPSGIGRRGHKQDHGAAIPRHERPHHARPEQHRVQDRTSQARPEAQSARGHILPNRSIMICRTGKSWSITRATHTIGTRTIAHGRAAGDASLRGYCPIAISSIETSPESRAAMASWVRRATPKRSRAAFR